MLFPPFTRFGMWADGDGFPSHEFGEWINEGIHGTQGAPDGGTWGGDTPAIGPNDHAAMVWCRCRPRGRAGTCDGDVAGRSGTDTAASAMIITT